MSQQADQPPLTRETILKRAHDARELFDDGRRRFTVKALCRDRYRCGPDYKGLPTDLSDDDIVEAAYGVGGASVYWRAWLLGDETRAEFVQVLAAHCAFDQDNFHRIWRTLLVALDRAPGGEDLIADARWLLDNPNTSCFVPTSLAEYLQPKPEVPLLVIPAKTSARRRGQPPVKFNRTVEGMRSALKAGSLTIEELDKATEESLATQFQVSRETARNARAFVLAHNVGISNSDK